MNRDTATRDTATLISWDEVALALDEEPLLLTYDNDRFTRRPRDLWVGVTVMLAVGVIAGCFFVGAFTVARWIWRLG